MIDQILAEIGIEGGSLSRMPRPHPRGARHAGHPQGDGAEAAREAAAVAAAAAAPTSERLGGGGSGGGSAEGHAMARVYVSSVINGRSDRVWARVRDFNGLPSWHPGIAESRIENGEPADKVGCVRDFRLRNGDRIREKLLGLSDFDLFCTYSILELPMGVENYVATLRLTPITDGDRTFVEWTAEFDCAPEREAELVSNIGSGVFQGGFDALKRQFGG